MFSTTTQLQFWYSFYLFHNPKMNVQQGKRPSYLAMVSETETRTELSPTDSDFPLTPADGSNHHIESSIHQRMQSQNSECSAGSYDYPLESCRGLIEVLREDDDRIDLEQEERVWSSFESDNVCLIHIIEHRMWLLTSPLYSVSYEVDRFKALYNNQEFGIINSVRPSLCVLEWHLDRIDSRRVKFVRAWCTN